MKAILRLWRALRRKRRYLVTMWDVHTPSGQEITTVIDASSSSEAQAIATKQYQGFDFYEVIGE